MTAPIAPSPDERISAALWYALQGFHILPLWSTWPDGTCRCPKGAACDQKPGKHPLTGGLAGSHGFKDATRDPDKIRKLLSIASKPNYGLVPPDGVFEADVDGPDLDRLAQLEGEHGPLPATLTTITAAGKHLFYRWPADVSQPTGKLFGFVTRWGAADPEHASGYVVGPRSVHPTGFVYQLENPEVLEISELPPSWVQAAKGTSQPVTITIGSGGYALPEEKVATNHRYDEIVKYTAHLHYYRRTPEEMWVLVQNLNAEYFQEPKDEGELRGDFKRAIKELDKKYPDKAREHESPFMAAEKVSAEGDVPSGRKQLVHRTARELASETPAKIDWCWTGYAARGAIAELDGRPKAAGKTTLLASLIRAVLDGADFLGTPTTRTPVVLLSEQTAGTMRVLLERAGLTERDDLHIVLWHDTREAQWPEIAAAAVELCHEVGEALLVVDTLPQFAGLAGDAENDSGAALAAMRPLQAAAASGLGVIVSRHDRKGGGEVGESARGSSAFAGAVDVILQLRRGEGDSRKTIRHLHALSRYDETPELLVIELTEEGYVVLGTDEAFAVQEARDKVLETLGDEGMTMAEIVTETKLKRTSVQSALTDLVADGKAIVDGAGKRADPYRWTKKVSAALTVVVPAETNHGNATPVADASLGDAYQPTASNGVVLDLYAEALRIFGEDMPA
jgi:hypothetical protein